MAEIVSLNKRFFEKQCQFHALNTLFERHPVVLVGDELGAFYLDKRIFPTDETEDYGNDNDAFYLWDKRDCYETKVSYMELVYAAFVSGVRDIVIDMVPAMQPGIDEALSAYREIHGRFTAEILFRTLLMSDVALPMDSVVQMAGSLGMKVHALNTGLTGVATLFRQAQGIKTVPQDLGFEEKVKHYRAHGFEKDKRTLRQIIRRRPTNEEIETLRLYMERRLGDKKEALEGRVFDEASTRQKIEETLGEKPFLGFFQNHRLFRGQTDLDGHLREIYGDDNVARFSLAQPEDDDLAKPSQYAFRYSRKNCAVAMTDAYARARHARGLPAETAPTPAANSLPRPLHDDARQIVTRIY